MLRDFLEVLKQLFFFFPKDFTVWALKANRVVIRVAGAVPSLSLQERRVLGRQGVLAELASVGSGAIK